MTKTLKCLVWDLDNTIWDGTLIEADTCRLRAGVKAVLDELDGRGILLSVASANDQDAGLAMLRTKGIEQLFVHPQIGWGNKVRSLQVIAEKLNLGLDSLGFIDDEPFELEQVRRLLPGVWTYPARDYRLLPQKLELTPEIVTPEAGRRRSMYLQEARRLRAQQASGMSHGEFLESCRCQIQMRQARADDMPRVLELMKRTSQMNATGVVYSPQQLTSFLTDGEHRIFVAEFKDRFVDYGTIGAAVCQRGPLRWDLLSFQISCRVSTRGIAAFFLSWLQRQAARAGASELTCRYQRRERNRRMDLLFRFSGFRQAEIMADGGVIFARKCNPSFHLPGWLSLNEEVRP